MRSFRDRDFVQTKEGFFFCVVGSIHPPEHVISYIKYVPSESGIWTRGEKKFSRLLQKYTIPNLLETFQYLKQNYPHYIFHSPVQGITITAVPHQNIIQHFKPEKKLAQLRLSKKLDSLQKKLIHLIQFLNSTSGISQEAFGITGSLLLDIHNPEFSDIDLTVYGITNSWTLKDALTKINPNMPMKRLAGKALEDWCLKKAQHYPMTPIEALKLYKRKWNLGFFENTWVSIHPIKLEKEVFEKYGQQSYRSCGQVTIRAEVRDDRKSLFLPAVYQIKDVNILNGPQYDPITEVISYETLYASLAKNGETIKVKGKLEKVTEKQCSRKYYRVLVGSAEGKGSEYIKLVE